MRDLYIEVIRITKYFGGFEHFAVNKALGSTPIEEPVGAATSSDADALNHLTTAAVKSNSAPNKTLVFVYLSSFRPKRSLILSFYRLTPNTHT